MDTIVSIDSLFSNKVEHRIIKTTPAITSVAAWINAETGVGPSIASGNQMCSPNWADLPKTPQNKKKLMTLIAENSKQKNENILFIALGVKAKITA